MTDALNLHAADALRALAEVLEKHPELPEPGYLTLSLWPDGTTPPHAGMQFGRDRAPRENVAAVAAWDDALATLGTPNLFGTLINGIRLNAYHPDYTAADLDDECTCSKHCVHR